MYKKNIANGENIIKYGDIGEEYYVLSKGKCEVTVYISGTDPADKQLASKINFVK